MERNAQKVIHQIGNKTCKQIIHDLICFSNEYDPRLAWFNHKRREEMKRATKKDKV